MDSLSDWLSLKGILNGLIVGAVIWGVNKAWAGLVRWSQSRMKRSREKTAEEIGRLRSDPEEQLAHVYDTLRGLIQWRANYTLVLLLVLLALHTENTLLRTLLVGFAILRGLEGSRAHARYMRKEKAIDEVMRNGEPDND